MSLQLKNNRLTVDAYLYKHSGMALVQVLLITSILAVFALYLTHTARQQVQQASWAKDKAQAIVNLQNAEAELFFQLMATNKGLRKEPVLEEQPVELNFFNEPFTIPSKKSLPNNGVEVQIQDQSGLVQLHFPNVERLKKLIGVIEKNSANVDVLVDRLLDWQDTDSQQRVNGAETNLKREGSPIRNGAVPIIGELKEIAGFSPELVNLIESNGTIYKVGAFNPFHATETLLAILIGEEAARQVALARKRGTMSVQEFSSLTGLTERDNEYFYTSNYMSIKLKSKFGESMASKSLIAVVQPYAEGKTSPLNIYVSRGK